ncbi:hypothetical protein FA15DRAFT_757674 [Coprinopsis marcescibilis]|uniref:DUF6534 domain-containing protein n=1 Tax=Coprinopsis marcescibilis TaxID=230819 RepID=A0A5C3KSR9_COPMA|nr:hypothetical protein FA15DRAFT_757674 [Coprinopsis marcescibilis]
MPDAKYPPRFKPSFARQAGAQMVSTAVTTLLYGVAIFMVAQYFFRHSRNDPTWIKVVAASLGVLATLQTIFANHQIYDYFVTNNNDTDARKLIPFSMPAKTACVFLTAFLSQIFYASRIWKLGRLVENHFRFLVVPIVALAILQLGGGMVQVVVMDMSKSYPVMFERVSLNTGSMYINGAATAACDILITIALVMILRSTNVNATRRTKTLLEKLVIYAINRGIVTSVFALLSIFLYNFTSGTFYFLIPFVSNTHVYIISVISMLTAREGLREDMDRSFHVSDLIMNTFTQKTENSGVTRTSTDVLDSAESEGTEKNPGTRDVSANCWAQQGS